MEISFFSKDNLFSIVLLSLSFVFYLNRSLRECVRGSRCLWLLVAFLTVTFLFLFSPRILNKIYATEEITLDANQIINDTTNKPIGINTNFIMDDDANRVATRSTATALEDMGVKFLRYPGGEKADAYLWSVLPFSDSLPTLARIGLCEWPSGDRTLVEDDGKTFKFDPLDFDEFMSLSKSVGAQVNLVVAYDSMYKPSSCSGITPTREQLLQTATEWVRYANVTKDYGVKYWEIGNESNQDHYNGTASASDYANDLKEFSQAMKAVDPGIKIGANGQKSGWWQTILSQSASAIDFLVVHEYPAWQWGNYEYYRTNTPNLTPNTDIAINAINNYAPPADRNRLNVAITEMNSFDWSEGGWSKVNNTGHALVLFEMVGEYLKKPQIIFSELWNTRWVKNNDPNSQNLSDALTSNNEFNPTGRVMFIWGNFIKDKLIAITSTQMVRAFASKSTSNNELSIFLLNKDTVSHTTQINLQNYSGISRASRWVFKGDTPEDINPTWASTETVTAAGNSLSLSLDPLSVTVLAFDQEIPTLTPSPSSSITPFSTPTPPPPPGDANGDGHVDGADFVVWLKNYGKNLSGATNGDFDNNGKVDGLDYVIWLNNICCLN